MTRLQDGAALVFISATALLSATSLLGIWEVFSGDVIVKSFKTFGLLAFVCVLIIAVGTFIERRVQEVEVPIVNPLFKMVRKATIAILAVSATLLAFLGVLSIWDILNGGDILFKSATSLAVVAFATFVVLITCFEREHSLSRKDGSKSHHPVLVGAVVLFLLLIALVVIGQVTQVYLGY